MGQAKWRGWPLIDTARHTRQVRAGFRNTGGTMTFYEKLNRVWDKSGSLVCVGLDPDLGKIPAHLTAEGGEAHPAFAFNRVVIDATADLVCAYKPQIAHFSGQALEKDLALTLDYLRERYPEIPVILDGKRGDVSGTAAFYAREAFDRYGADALTVNPYLGGDSMEPFLERKDKGVVILCRTSNPGAGDLQDLEVEGRKLYLVVAEKAVKNWNYNGNVVLVAGATYPQELEEIRSIAGDMPLLVPGVGAQGGDIEAVIKSGLDSRGAGLIINSSRGIIYAGSGEDFADSARLAARKLRDEINKHR